VEPRVLLLDEPFGALDAKVRKELRRWLRRLHDELHVTSIFVTHDQEEALEVADRVVLMNKGHVEQVGTPEEVYEHPATPFVYGFLGAVNLFHGRVEGEHVKVGEAALPHDGRDADHGSEVVGFARPHELDIVTDPNETRGVAAVVSRVLAFGASARVELDSLEGAAERGEPAHYEVVLPRERITALALTEGQHVRLVPSALRVFPREAA
jgi:sulfate transport system ATP-binding protein